MSNSRDCDCEPVGFGISGFALVVVLFILLIIVGASWVF